MPDASPLVLIVDDNQKNVKLTRDVLRAAGFRTLEAANGTDGIALANEHLGLRQCPHGLLKEEGIPLRSLDQQELEGAEASVPTDPRVKEQILTTASAGR